MSRTEAVVLESRERRERSLRSELGKTIVELVNRLLGVLEVPLRAFLLQGIRRKAVAERPALLYVSGSVVGIYIIY